MKKLLSLLMFFVFANLVQAGLISNVGDSFRRMLNDANFLYFFFYVLVFVVLFAVFNSAGMFLPMFKENQRNRKVFAVTISLLVTTLLFVNYRGSFVDMISEALGDNGKLILLLIGLIALIFIILAAFKGSGGGTSSKAGTIFKWIIIIAIIILAIWVLSSMFGGGGGFGIGGNIGDWLFLAIALFLIGLIIYFIFKGTTGGGVGGGGSKTPSEKTERVKKDKTAQEQNKQLSKEEKKAQKLLLKNKKNESVGNISYQIDEKDIAKDEV